MKSILNEESLTAWSDLRAGTPENVRTAVADLAHVGAVELTDGFYEYMLSHSVGSMFLDLQLVDKRLRKSMEQWLDALFSTEVSAQDALHLQATVGKVHARIRVPMELIQSGLRILKQSIHQRLDRSGLDELVRAHAKEYVSDMFCLAGGAMTLAYLASAQEALRNEVSYRLVTQKKSASFERVRQRAALSEWAETAFLSAWSRSSKPLSHLRESEFGVWMHHKGSVLFGDAPDLKVIFELIADLDTRLLPVLQSHPVDDGVFESAIEAVRQRLGLIRLKLGDLFDQLSAQQEGLDIDTQLPDRRYLPAILSNELRTHLDEDKTCSLLIIDIDLAGPEGQIDAGARGRLLRSVATVITDCAHTGDQLFRFDEHRFLLIAVECDATCAARMAHRVAEEVSAALQAFNRQGHWTPIQTGVCIGVAEYDRHPDYMYFLQRAEAALQVAKAQGPDQVAFA